MTVNIAILGLGQVGASLGLALAAHKEKLRRVGLDKDPETSARAKKLGAVDATEYNLPNLAAKADVVLLCLPFDQVSETLTIIAPDLRENAVLLDFSPLHAATAAWCQANLPVNRHYIGIAASLSIESVEEPGQSPRANLFDRAVFGIAPAPGTPAEAVALAADLASMVQARPLFMDMAEADGLMSAAHLLPQLTSLGLLDALLAQPGWREARKLAGQPFFAAAQGLRETPGALAHASIHHPEHTVRLLDALIASLQAMREDIHSRGEKSLEQRASLAQKGLNSWLKDRTSADWDSAPAPERPSLGEAIQRLFLGAPPTSKR